MARTWTKSDYQGACAYCYNLLKNKKRQKHTTKKHKYEILIQKHTFAQEKLNLKEDTCLIVQDFAKHYIQNQVSFSDL